MILLDFIYSVYFTSGTAAGCRRTLTLTTTMTKIDEHNSIPLNLTNRTLTLRDLEASAHGKWGTGMTA